MKTLFVVPVHSFVDTITNSSSELFVYTGDKSLELIRKTLIRLQNAHKIAEGDPSGPLPELDNELDLSMFREPYVSNIDFDISKYPKWKEYNRLFSFNLRQQDPHRVADEREWYHWSAHHENASAEERRDQYERLMGKWHKLEDEAERELYAWVFEQNGIDVKFVDGDPATNYERNQAWLAARDRFSEFVNYKVTVHKGDIVIRSADDNSIPWTMMDMICEHISSKRYHLG